MGKSVCFFARVSDRAVLDRVGFYAQDLAMLKELGYSVTIATSPREIVKADLYFVWWWTYAFLPLLHPKRFGAPVVVTGTFDLWLYNQRPLHQRALLALALRAATMSAFHSKSEYEQVPTRLSVRQSTYTPPAVDTHRYQMQGERERFVFTLASMGGFNAWRKCAKEILDAAALHPTTRFVVAGEWDTEARSLAAQHPNVTVLGVVSETEKIRLMQTCAVYLQPTRYEGFGVAIAEAMSCGAPIVTSEPVRDVAGPWAEYVTTEPLSIAEGIATLLADPCTARLRGQAGRDRIRTRFSAEQHRERWGAALERLSA